jgi:hypothetical protein
MGSFDYLCFNGYTVSACSTLDLSDSQAIILIAKHMGVYEKNLDPYRLLERILFKLTDENEYSPYMYNNYSVSSNTNHDIEL